MDALLGFAVLTSPLFLIVLWVPVCIALAIWVGRKAIKKNLSTRIAGGLLVFVLALFLPVADEITGRIYFNHLCETEAGVKVYQTIELPAEYWDKDGKPRFTNARGVWDVKMLGGRFEWRRETNPVVSSLIRINQEKWILYDNQSSKKLGEKVDFIRFFGWLNTFSPAPNVSESCLNYWADKYGRDGYIAKEASNRRESINKQIFVLPDNMQE